MSSTKVCLFSFFLILSGNNFIMAMEGDTKKETINPTYPSDLHPKAVRKIFENNRNRDFLDRLITHNKLKEDPNYYLTVNQRLKTILNNKISRCSEISSKKSWWGSTKALLGLGIIGAGGFVVRHTFEAAKSIQHDADYIRGWGMFGGALVAAPGGYFFYKGVKKVWNNRSSTIVHNRLERHQAADNAVSQYLNEVFDRKETDSVSRWGSDSGYGDK